MKLPPGSCAGRIETVGCRVEGWAFDPAAPDGRCEIDVLIEGRAKARFLSGFGDAGPETRRLSLDLGSLLREERQEVDLRFARTGIGIPGGRFAGRTPIPPSRRLIGMNGHRFDKGPDDLVLNDVSGRRAPDLAALENLAAFLAGLDIRLAARGGRLTVLIAPDRMTVAPASVARHFTAYAGRSSRILLEFLTRWGVEVADPVEGMRDDAATCAMMPKMDDRLGSAAVAHLIAAAFGLERRDSREGSANSRALPTRRTCGSLADIGSDEAEEIDRRLEDIGSHRRRFRQADGLVRAELIAGSAADGEALVFGGDLARELSQRASPGLARVGFVRSRGFIPDIIEELRPSRAIVVLAESDLVSTAEIWTAMEASFGLETFLETWRNGICVEPAARSRRKLR